MLFGVARFNLLVHFQFIRSLDNVVDYTNVCSKSEVLINKVEMQYNEIKYCIKYIYIASLFVYM